MTMRYCQMYATGATGRLAEFAQKKYRGHRCLPDSWWTKLTAEYKTTFGKDAEFREDVDTLKSAAAAIEDRDLLDEEEANDDEEPEEAVQEEEAKEVEEDADQEENADDIEMELPDDDKEVEEQEVRRSARSNFGQVRGARTFFGDIDDDEDGFYADQNDQECVPQQEGSVP